MNIRRLIGKLTTPIFVPLRRFIVWGDKTFGTCDYTLTIKRREGLDEKHEQ